MAESRVAAGGRGTCCHACRGWLAGPVPRKKQGRWLLLCALRVVNVVGDVA